MFAEEKIFFGSLSIAPTRNFTLFLKIGFVVAGGGFYSYYIHQGNKSDKERKIVRKKLSFMHTKRFNIFFKRWVQFRVGGITIFFIDSSDLSIWFY